MVTNSVLWFEVLGKDGKALRKFYGELFGWSIQEAGGETDYGLVGASNGGVGGGIGTSQDGGPGFATFYVEVDDIGQSLAKAQKLGGKVLLAETDIPDMNLKFAYFTDPEGHVIGLSKGMAQMAG